MPSPALTASTPPYCRRSVPPESDPCGEARGGGRRAVQWLRGPPSTVVQGSVGHPYRLDAHEYPVAGIRSGELVQVVSEHGKHVPGKRQLPMTGAGLGWYESHLPVGRGPCPFDGDQGTFQIEMVTLESENFTVPMRRWSNNGMVWTIEDSHRKALTTWGRLALAAVMLAGAVAVSGVLAAPASARGVQVVATVLVDGDTLPPGQALLSPNGNYMLIMQNDGNLVEYVWTPVCGGESKSWRAPSCSGSDHGDVGDASMVSQNRRFRRMLGSDLCVAK